MVARYRIRVGRRIGSAALVADGLHARTDGFTSLAVLVAAAGVLLGFPMADPIVGLVIAVAILAVLRAAARDVYRRLMDSVDPELTDRAERVVARTPGVVGVERVRLRWTGHRVLAEASVVVDERLDLVAAHAIAHEAAHRMRHGIGRLDDVTVHVSPQSTPERDHHAAVAHHTGPWPDDPARG